MVKERTSKRKGTATTRLKKQVETALGGGGKGAVWIRESDGAVCVGDECLVITNRSSGGIDIQVDAGACGSEYREKLIDNFTRGAGKGVNIRIRSPHDDDD